MKGFRLRRCRAVVAGAILGLALGGCAGQSTRALRQSTAPAEPERSAGGKIFDKWCGDCHSAVGGPGSIALQRRYQGSLPAVLEQRSDLRPEYVKQAVRHGVSFMPSFRKTEISDADLALLAAYLTSGKTPK
jgi:mono/diheme cytochrome c family protein